MVQKLKMVTKVYAPLVWAQEVMGKHACVLTLLYIKSSFRG